MEYILQANGFRLKEENERKAERKMVQQNYLCEK